VAGAAALGFGIWASSPVLTGHAEPWDSEHAFYSVALLIGGSVLGLLRSRHLLLCYLGAWSGQVVALAVLPGLDRGWLLLGVITTAMGSVWILPGAVAGRVFRRAVDGDAPRSR
jgi:hypothetical protein